MLAFSLRTRSEWNEQSNLSETSKNSGITLPDASRAESGGVKARERVVEHGEVFTPAWAVNEMLDLLPDRGEKNVWATPQDAEQKRFLDPTCGEGAFLVEVLDRKLRRCDRYYTKDQASWEWHSSLAVSSVYGIELLEDNRAVCIENLYAVYLARYQSHYRKTPNDEALAAIRFLISTNIVQGDSLTFKRSDDTPIVVAEFKPIVSPEGVRMLRRVDYDLSQMSRAKTEPDLFTMAQEDPGLIATYEPVPWMDIVKAKPQEDIKQA